MRMMVKLESINTVGKSKMQSARFQGGSEFFAVIIFAELEMRLISPTGSVLLPPHAVNYTPS